MALECIGIAARGVALVALVLAVAACSSADGPPRELHAVYVESLALDERTDTPVVILRESNGNGRELPIWIGLPEAQSIAMALEDVELPRPNTHDLIKNLLDGIQGDIDRVVITELRGHTYYAAIDVQLDGQMVTIDSRPSDAIAVAIRTGAPLFATDQVLVRSDLDEEAELPLDILRELEREPLPDHELRVH